MFVCWSKLWVNQWNCPIILCDWDFYPQLLLIYWKVHFWITTLIFSLSPSLPPSLGRQCPLTLNVTSRRCLGMCWMRSSRPSVSADCVRQPQGAPPPTSPCHPPPSLKHNIIMLRNTAAGTSSTALFISPQIRTISFPLPSSSSPVSPHSVVPVLSELCGHSPTLDVVLQSHRVHAPSSLRCILIFTCWFLIPSSSPCCSLTLYWAPVSGCSAFSALSHAPLCPPLCRQFSVWQSCNLMLTTGLLLLMVEMCFYSVEVFGFVFCLLFCLFLFFCLKPVCAFVRSLSFCSLNISVCAARLCRPRKTMWLTLSETGPSWQNGDPNLLTHHWTWCLDKTRHWATTVRIVQRWNQSYV